MAFEGRVFFFLRYIFKVWQVLIYKPRWGLQTVWGGEATRRETSEFLASRISVYDRAATQAQYGTGNSILVAHYGVHLFLHWHMELIGLIFLL